MNNPILGALNTQRLMPQNMGQIKQAFNMVKNAGNPQAMLESMMLGNPKMKQLADIIKQSGGDPQKAFYTLAKEKGVDPNQILNMLK